MKYFDGNLKRYVIQLPIRISRKHPRSSQMSAWNRETIRKISSIISIFLQKRYNIIYLYVNDKIYPYYIYSVIL